MVARTRLNVMLYEHCLSGYLQILMRTFFALIDTDRVTLETHTETQINLYVAFFILSRL